MKTTHNIESNLDSMNAKILIIDDSINNIELLSDILIDDYLVLFANSGKKALNIIKEAHPDLILLDVVMPDMNGYEVINILKKNPETENIPIIFITAKSSTEDMVKGFKLGAVDYISKPFAAEEVKVRVNTQIQNQLLFKALKQANHQLQKLSRMDGLTNIANRRHFDDFLQKMINRSKRHNTPISLLIIDIDYFKLYNDHYGHQQGDLCLTKVAKKLDQYAQRDGELTARYGGEEFAIILSEMPADKAVEHAKKCQQSIQALQIVHEKSTCNPFVTISVGLVTQLGEYEMTPQSLIKKADTALYQAKESGRNRLFIYSD